MPEGEGSAVEVARGRELQQYDPLESRIDLEKDPHIGKRLIEYCRFNCHRWTEWELTPQGRVCASCKQFRRVVGIGGWQNEAFGDDLDLRPAGGEADAE